MAEYRQYALRMDFVPEDQEPLEQWFSSLGSKYFAVEEDHDGENRHIHAVFDSKYKASSLRNSFKRAFPSKAGNGAYSLKECDDDIDAYMRYMCKGADKETSPQVLCYMGLDFTPEAIESWHEQYWVNNEALAINKRKRGDLGGNMVEQVERICKAKGVKGSDRRGIAEVYLRLLSECRKPINLFAGKSIVNCVSIVLDGLDGGERDNIAMKMAEL